MICFRTDPYIPLQGTGGMILMSKPGSTDALGCLVDVGMATLDRGLGSYRNPGFHHLENSDEM
jgi:hypothetical protein